MNQPAMNTMAPGLKPGDKLVHFEVQQQLASGGAGIVWRGYDSLLSRHVAIKQIASADMVDQVFIEKFRQEAELQKKVSQNHPNLVNVIDCVSDQRGVFIVMEFVEGPSLAQALTQVGGPVPVLQALTIIRDVAQGLMAIHGAGIVHRDLKPGNILLTADGKAKVADFGQATVMAEQEMQAMGTAQYMAPEQFSEGAVDGRADMYALGMIAYEMLVGRPEYEQIFKAVMRDQRNAQMRWMKWHTNPRVSAPAAHTHNPQVPEVLSDLVARLMSKDAGQRIPNSQVLLETIQRHFSKGAQQQQPAGGAPAAAPTAAAAAAAGAAAPAAAATGAAESPAPGAPTGAAAPVTSGAFDQATAALPTRGNLPWILAAILLVQVLVIGGYMMVQQQKEDDAEAIKRNDGLVTFKQAIQTFEDDKFADAQVMFQELAEEWPKDPILGTGASSYGLVSQARIDMKRAEEQTLAEQYDPALATYATAEEALTKAQDQVFADPVARQKGEKLVPMIDRFVDEIKKRRVPFLEYSQTVAKSIDEARYDAARSFLNELKSSTLTPIPEEKSVMASLERRINDQTTAKEVETGLAEAKALTLQEKFNEADLVLAKALERWPTNDEIRKLMGDNSRRNNLNEATRRANEAEAKGDLRNAIVHYTEINRLTPDKKWTEKIQQLKGQIAFNEAEKLEEDGKLEQAYNKYAEADSYWPNPIAKERMMAMQLADKRTSLIRAGDIASRKGEYEKAISLYEQAQKIQSDTDTLAKIKAAQLRVQVAGAIDAFRGRDLSGALQHLSQALAIDPNDQEALSLQRKIDLLQTYDGHVGQGIKLRQQGKFGLAIKSFLDAIKIATDAGIPADDVKKLRDDTEYDLLVQQGKEYMELKQWQAALAKFKNAKGIHDTDALQLLILEVEGHLR